MVDTVPEIFYTICYPYFWLIMLFHGAPVDHIVFIVGIYYVSRGSVLQLFWLDFLLCFASLQYHALHLFGT